MEDNVADVTVQDNTLVVESNGSAAPFVVTVQDGVCSVAVLATNGKPFATVKVIDKETGTEVPVNVYTCAEAVVCNAGIPMQIHLQNLYGHAEDADLHLAEGEKQNLETKAGAQAKATAAKSEAIAAASLEIAAVRRGASDDATAKANAARDAAYRYADGISANLSRHTSDANNPHGVTAAQVGLGNVPNKSTNNLEPTYSVSGSLAELQSGEKLSVAFGKIAKAIVDLIAHIGNKSNPHNVTPAQIGAASAVHSHYDEFYTMQETDNLLEDYISKHGGQMFGNLVMDDGHIVLKRGVNFGTEDEIPDDLPNGGLFFKVVG